MINYRLGTLADAEDVARLHALNWQLHYKGIMREDYLKKEVVGERIAVWTNRLQKPKDNQHLVVARDQGKLCGFVCTFLNDDPKYGALLDNLHVAPEMLRKGLGRDLMKIAARWVQEQDPSSALYLYVLEKNHPARIFYERLGAIMHNAIMADIPGGNRASIIRCVWPDLNVLM